MRARQQSLFGGLAGSVLVVVAGNVLAGVQGVFAARQMGTREFGVLAYVLGWVDVLRLVAPLGFDSLLLRKIPELLQQRDVRAARALIIFARMTTACIGVALGAATGALVSMSSHDAQLASAGVASAAILPIVGLSYVSTFLTQALRHPVLGAASRSPGISPLCVLTAITVCAVAAVPPRAIPVIGVIGSVHVLVLAMNTVVAHRALKRRGVTDDIGAHYDIHRWTSTALTMLVFSSSFYVLQQTDVALLGLLVSPEAAGSYAVISQLSNMSTIGLLAVNVVVPPLFAELHSGARSALLQRAARVFCVLSLGVYVPLAGAMIVSLDGLITFARVEAPHAHLTLIILLLGRLANVATGSCGYLLTMTGHHAVGARATLTAGIVNLALNVLLIPAWGPVGAAISTTIAIAGSNIWMAMQARARTGVDPSILSTLRATPGDVR